jgi:glutathione synthase/RimK-type ligase-like ATP-grasp enzyme
VSHVALATSRFALPGATPSLEAHVDVDSPLLINELERLGVAATLEVWDDDQVDWESYDLVVVRSTWGYASTYREFLAWAHARSRLVNPYDVLEYSSDKRYLGDLAAQGFSVIATSYCEVGEEPVFPAGDFVVKPAVGAGSIDAERYAAGDDAGAREHVARLHASGRCAVIQPYVSSIDEYGERALIFFDGEFSHAMTKRAHLNVAPEERDGDFRTRQMSRAEAESEALQLARELLTGRFVDLAYARVDLVNTPDGWQLMELELVEPALYLNFDDDAATRAARAIARRIPTR